MLLPMITYVMVIHIVLHSTESCRFGPGCTYKCHCQNSSFCDVTTGECPSGCDDGDLGAPGGQDFTLPWTGYGCQIGNVALYKTASFVASGHLGVDGRHPADSYSSYSSCAFSSWWQVDLEQEYVIIGVRTLTLLDDEVSDVKISREATSTSFERFWTDYIVEGETNAYSTEPKYTTYSGNQTIGRHVRVSQSGYFSVCEVEVQGYLYVPCSNSYGEACSRPCNCLEPCDELTGLCRVGCVPGYSGPTCQTRDQAQSTGDSNAEIPSSSNEYPGTQDGGESPVVTGTESNNEASIESGSGGPNVIVIVLAVLFSVAVIIIVLIVRFKTNICIGSRQESGMKGNDDPNPRDGGSYCTQGQQSSETPPSSTARKPPTRPTNTPPIRPTFTVPTSQHTYEEIDEAGEYEKLGKRNGEVNRAYEALDKSKQRKNPIIVSDLAEEATRESKMGLPRGPREYLTVIDPPPRTGDGGHSLAQGTDEGKDIDYGYYALEPITAHVPPRFDSGL